jgi:hypothetical protein
MGDVLANDQPAPATGARTRVEAVDREPIAASTE